MWSRIPAAWAKFLLILIPILLVSTLGFATVFFLSKHTELRQGLADRVDRIADGNVPSLAGSLWTFDSTGTRSILAAIMINHEIRCVAVEDDLIRHTYILPETGCDGGPGPATVSRDIRRGTQHLGRLTLSYGYESVETLLQEEIVNGAWLLLLMLTVTVATALIAYRVTVGVPLARLVDSIRQAEQQGNRDLVDWRSNDELGRLIAAYNRLLVKLAYEEARLRKSEERLSLAISATRSSIWDMDLTNGQIWWSLDFPKMLGYGLDALPMTVTTLESLIHPEDRDRVLGESLRHIAGETATYSNVYRVQCRDGTWRWVEDRATAIRDGDGVALRLTGILADITERKQAELDLASERAILQATLENVDQGIVMFDADLRLVTFNRRAADLLNVPLKVLTTRPTFEDIVRCQIERGEWGDDSSAERQSKPWEQLPGDYIAIKHRRPDGTVILIQSNPLFMGGFVCTYGDVTAETRATEDALAAMQATARAYAELKETQASLVQAEKMASLGLLVAGIAHEINTPVGIAFSCASHLGNRTRELVEALGGGALKKSELTAYANAALESTRLMSTNLSRAAELIRSFKHVAVDQASAELRCFDLKTYIDEVVTSLGPRLRTTPHRVTVDCPDGIAMDGYPGALSQVLTNLIMNALVHAFADEQSGTISISVDDAGDGGDVELLFSDDGRGIPPDQLDKVFEPFFTTRRGAGGSGLGLHIVFNLVTQTLGGRIAVDSAAGRGTTFRVRLPRVAPRQPTPDAENADSPAPSSMVPS